MADGVTSVFLVHLIPDLASKSYSEIQARFSTLSTRPNRGTGHSSRFHGQEDSIVGQRPWDRSSLLDLSNENHVNRLSPESRLGACRREPKWDVSSGPETVLWPPDGRKTALLRSSGGHLRGENGQIGRIYFLSDRLLGARYVSEGWTKEVPQTSPMSIASSNDPESVTSVWRQNGHPLTFVFPWLLVRPTTHNWLATTL